MDQAAQSGNFLASFLPLIVLFAIFYFLVIRPQQTQAKKHKEMIGGLKKGDKIVTNGGFIVEIIKVEEEFLKVEFENGVTARLDKDYVARKFGDEN